MKRQRVKRPKPVLDQAARDNINRAIKESGLLVHKFPPFQSWDELRDAQRESGLPQVDAGPDEELSLELNIALECLSSFHAYVAAATMPVFFNVTRQGANKRPKLQASLTLLAGMAADLGAIGTLVREGFDVQAKVIVRTLREKLDALIAAQLDRSFAVDYVKNDDPEAANRFWHRRVAKGRLIKNIARRLSHYSAAGDSPIDAEWLAERRELEHWLGQAVHPSHVSGFLAAFPNFGTNDQADATGVFGLPSDISLITIRTVLAFAYEVVLLTRWRRLSEWPEGPMSTDLRRSVNELKPMLESLEKFVIRCNAESSVRHNLELLQLQLYLEGYMLAPIEGPFDKQKYKGEILDALTRVLATVLDRPRDLIS